jgi:pimeloyl-ACP methyl ester carboxylesterase
VTLTRRLLLAGAGLAAAGAPASAWSRPAPAPDATSETGSILIQSQGEGERALVLIPGLAGGAWSWDDIAPRLSRSFEVHSLTLPGFDGRPPIGAPMIDAVVADIARFVAERAPERPIVVGHSLGAFVALRLALGHPTLVGGLVTVDGYPVFPPLADASPKERRAAALRRAQPFLAATDKERFRETLRSFLAARMNDPRRAALAAERAARSDPRATGDYVVEMLSADLRPELPRLATPLLALAAVDSYRTGGEEEVRRFYRAMLAAAPRASVVTIRNSRHFVAEDQPDALCAAIEAYAAGLALSTVAPR